MKILRRGAAAALVFVGLCGALAPVAAPHPYDEQYREFLSAPPSARFPLGTDDLGRDRLSRLLYATLVSAALAPASALVSVAIGLLVSIPAAFSRYGRTALSGFATISLSLPWIFAFIALRAELPLDMAPLASLLITFGVMGVAGWAWPARILTAALAEMNDSGWMLQARASGLPVRRIARVHAWPHVAALAAAQFRVLVPVYILSEASLGLLGLGVSEPLPSWGTLLRELQHPDLIRANPWILAPLALLVLVTVCLEILGSSGEVPA